MGHLLLHMRNKLCCIGGDVGLVGFARRAWVAAIFHCRDVIAMLSKPREWASEHVQTAAIAAAPGRAPFYNNLGEIHAAAARYRLIAARSPAESVQLGLAAYERAAELMPNHPIPVTNLARLHLTSAQHDLRVGSDPRRDLARAREALERALALNPAHVRAMALQGIWALLSSAAGLEPIALADPAFEKAIAAASDDREVAIGFARLALYHLSMGPDQADQTWLNEGLAAAERAEATGSTEAILLRAALLRTIDGRNAEADALQARALAVNPNLRHHWAVVD